MRQAETRRQGDAIPACQHDDQSLATIRRYASSQRIAEGAQTLGIELGERLNSVACVLEYSHAPGLSGAGVRRSRVKDVEARAGVGAGDDAPRGAVPLFDHRLLDPAADHRPHRPDVVGGDDDDASELPGAWASDDAPRGAVPVFDQGLHCAAGSTGLSHGPDLIRRDRSCGLQGVEPRADAGAGDDAPRGAVPVFGERLHGHVDGWLEVAHGPDVSGGDGCHSSQLVVLRAGIGAGDDAPLVAVPVLDEGLQDVAGIPEIAHRPDITGGDGRDRGKNADLFWDPGHAPTRAVPVLDEWWPPGAGEPDGPDIVGRDGGHAEEVVIPRADVGAGNDAPRGAVPVFGERHLAGGSRGLSHGPHIVGGDAGRREQFVARYPRVRAGDDGPGSRLRLRHRGGQQQGDQHRSDHTRKETDLQKLHATPLKLLLSGGQEQNIHRLCVGPQRCGHARR